MSFHWVILMRDPCIGGTTVVYLDFSQGVISRRIPKAHSRAEHSKVTTLG